MSKLGSFFRDYLTPALVLLLGGVMAYDHLAPKDVAVAPTGVNGKALGHKFAGSVAASFGDAWESAAETLAAGKSIAEAQATMQTTWQEGRAKAFATVVAPEFSKVLGEGSEPADAAQRASVVQLWRDFATGLKGGR